MALLLFFGGTALAQNAEEPAGETKNWKVSGFSGLTLNQVALVNWAAGGENSFSATILAKIDANYAKDKITWDNSFDAAWGLIKTKSDVRKNEDRMEVNSQAGYKLNEKGWQASLLLNFKSQFTKGFNYSDDQDVPDVLVSKFAAPASLAVGAGVSYKKDDIFTFYASPATGKFTFVREDERIAEEMYGLDSGDKVRAEFGAYVSLGFKKELFKNVTLASKLDLFNNYTDPNKDNRKYVDVDWKTSINMKVNSWLTASILTHMIYDHDIQFVNEDTGELEDKVQFKEAFGIGLSYNFSNIKE